MTRKETQRTEHVGLTHGNVTTLCQERKGMKISEWLYKSFTEEKADDANSHIRIIRVLTQNSYHLFSNQGSQAQDHKAQNIKSQ